MRDDESGYVLPKLEKFMKKISPLIVLSGLLAVSNGYAVTHTCNCTVKNIHAGFMGGTGNSAKSKIDCVNGGPYYIGNIDNDLVKVRHSMALAAQMASKEVVLQYWSSDGSKNCSLASSDTNIFPDGLYVK